jgi:hypothetical protein
VMLTRGGAVRWYRVAPVPAGERIDESDA